MRKLTALYERLLRSEDLLRYLSYLWNIIVFIFILVDYASAEEWAYLLGPLLITYMGVLSLYVATKEFSRWASDYHGKHPGEVFILVWTLLMIFLFFSSLLDDSHRRVNSEIVATYIGVLSVFIVSREAKFFIEQKLHKKEDKL